jgi:hypothetical protein
MGDRRLKQYWRSHSWSNWRKSNSAAIDIGNGTATAERFWGGRLGLPLM